MYYVLLLLKFLFFPFNILVKIELHHVPSPFTLPSPSQLPDPESPPPAAMTCIEK